jgi:hypothetical protein
MEGTFLLLRKEHQTQKNQRMRYEEGLDSFMSIVEENIYISLKGQN